MRWLARCGLVVAAVVLVVGSGWLRVHYKEFVWYRFVEVKPGVLYRSGQLTARQMEAAIRRHGLRTVVNLRKVDEDPEAFGREEEVCRRLGVALVHLPMGREEEASQRQIDRFVELSRGGPARPILVHCKHGVKRTGFAVMAYRLRVDGWTREDAVEELVRCGREETSYSVKPHS